MPYYHADIFPTVQEPTIWGYFETYIPFLQKYIPGKPILISQVWFFLKNMHQHSTDDSIMQTLWSSIEGGSHDRGFGNPAENIGNFTLYWDIIMSKCQYFKEHKVGWFVHTYDDSQEPGLGMINDAGQTKMSFHPPSC